MDNISYFTDHNCIQITITTIVLLISEPVVVGRAAIMEVMVDNGSCVVEDEPRPLPGPCRVTMTTQPPPPVLCLAFGWRDTVFSCGYIYLLIYLSLYLPI